MQLTNIARDVGEDAREGRLYLPTEWFTDADLDPNAFLAKPEPTPQIRRMAKRLVMEANRLYYRSEVGIPALPVSARPGIFAARLIYAGIGGRLDRMDYDSISDRARMSKPQKIGWLMASMARSGLSTVMPGSPVIYAPPLPEVAFLVDAAENTIETRTRSEAFVEALAALEAHSRARRNAMLRPAAS